MLGEVRPAEAAPPSIRRQPAPGVVTGDGVFLVDVEVLCLLVLLILNWFPLLHFRRMLEEALVREATA